MTSATYLVAILLPFLNEESTLAATCASLGFGTPYPPDDTYLILVDNASTDASPEIARSIQEASPNGRVLLVLEPERGFVPVRRRAVHVAHTLSRKMGIEPANVLLVQADADTLYSDGYVEAQRSVAEAAGVGMLIEATTSRPALFKSTYPRYAKLSETVDARFEEAERMVESIGVVVDDKAAAFRLADYYKWGGFTKESYGGEEILLETSRLFIAGRASGAQRVSNDKAHAWHSVRRIEEQPLRELAMAGFPRSAGLTPASSHDRLPLLEQALAAGAPWPVFELSQRSAYLAALLVMLPFHVARSLGSVPVYSSAIGAALRTVPIRTQSDVERRPGRLIADMFHLIDTTMRPALNPQWLVNIEDSLPS